MRLRPATMADAEMLLRWRNDPATCAASIDTDTVALSDHMRWLEASIANPNRDLLIAEDGEPVGTVRIDRGESETEMSWTVAPEMRGRGYGAAMVCAAVNGAATVATIKRGNVASQKIAAAAGFRLVEDGELQRWESTPTPYADRRAARS